MLSPQNLFVALVKQDLKFKTPWLVARDPLVVISVIHGVRGLPKPSQAKAELDECRRNATRPAHGSNEAYAKHFAQTQTKAQMAMRKWVF